MKKIIISLTAVISLFLLSSILFIGCKKDLTDLINLPPDPSDTSYEIPEYTAIGTPAGNPVTKNIGPAGGSISSDDGLIQLSIPAGALTANTDITIQPITNECPGGIGLAYDMLPNGTKFKVPATITFHYTDDDLAGADPYFFFIAYQDSSFAWKADMINRDVDTIAKTVSLDISHFTGYGKGQSARCYGDPDQLHKGETSNVRAIYSLKPPSAPKGTNPDDDLAPLTPTKELSRVSNWRVNGIVGGSNVVGTITGTGSSVTYTAPASILKKQIVRITAQYDEPVTFYKKRKKVTQSNFISIGGNITLLPNPFSYKVTVAFQQSKTNECFVDNYTDTSTMRVDVNNDEVTISEIKNYEPSTDPSSGNTPDGKISCDWQKTGDAGMINFTGASGNVSLGATASSDKLVHIILEGEGHFAKWKVIDNVASLTYFSGGDPFPAFPPSIGFTLNKTDQEMVVTVPQNAAGITGSAKITVKVLP